MFRVRFYPALAKIAERDERAGVLRAMEQLKNRVADNSHNDFLQVWIENGALGFIFCTLAMAIMAGEIFEGLFSRKLGGGESWHLPAFGAAFICLLVNATFSFPLHTPTRAVLFWCLLGVSHAAVLTRIGNAGHLSKYNEGKI